MSAQARRALVRVALAMGAREGTSPENHPITRSLSSRARAEGRVEGAHATVLQVLRSRGIFVSASLSRRSAEVGEVPHDVLVNAALACRDETDFLRRIREAARRYGNE